MMADVFQVTLSWLVSYIVYYALLQKQTFFNGNRIYLLASLLIGLLMPWLSNKLTFDFGDENVYYIQMYAMELDMSTKANILNANSIQWMYVVYIIGLGLSVSKLGYGLSGIYELYKNGEKIAFNNYTKVKTFGNHLPFSFFRFVFISDKRKLTSNLDKIIEHELIHITHWHSLDVLFVEILHCIFWFNPLLILYKKAIKQCHEFHADAEVIKHTSIRQYINMLTSYQFEIAEHRLANHFFHSQIKNRLHMLETHKSSKAKLLYYLMPLPFMMMITILFSSSPSSAKAAVSQLFNDGLSIESDTVPTKPLPPPPPPRDMNKKHRAVPNDVPPPPPPPPPPSFPSQKSEVYMDVEVMPRFPGCEDIVGSNVDKDLCAKNKLMEYIGANLKYPEEARLKNIEGMCVVQFKIGADGYIYEAELLKDAGGGTGQEALRVIESMNKMSQRWTPGYEKGKAVKVAYTLPLKFKLTDDKEVKDK